MAVAKTGAALLSGSASMVAEAAHSWADTGNEVFLLVAERRGARPRDAEHPRGHGRETYVWSLFAAFGLFMVGAAVSVLHGIQQLSAGASEGDYLVNYVVLGVAFVLEGVSFGQALRQTRGSARKWGLHPLSYINRTSNPTLRAVFVEDSSALTGLVLAAIGVLLHELTGNAVWDAVGSIAVGLLLGGVAIFLIRRNSQFLLGEAISPVLRERVLEVLAGFEEIDRVTYLHLEYVGPLRFFVVAAVDLTGDDPEPQLAVRLRALEARLEGHESVEDAVLTLSTPDEPSLLVSEHWPQP
ncbi:MAG: cation diffusion facilitator family transporter [Actinomycetota bacterium]|nr:cation diffusion facilitator family transporter [Actinomycetota bacterium]